MNYAEIKQYDVANGPVSEYPFCQWLYTSLYKNVFNPETWILNMASHLRKRQYRRSFPYMEPEYVKGITLLGGEPLEHSNQKGLYHLSVRSKKNIRTRVYGALPDMILKKMYSDAWSMNGKRPENCYLI